MKNYEERRRNLYLPLREEGIFTWDWFEGEEYALASVHSISGKFRRELSEATEALGCVFARVSEVVRLGGDELLKELALPEETWKAVQVHLGNGLPTVIGRFDFAQTPEGLKMLEFNSDTPTGVVEAFYVNGYACRMAGLKNPNAGMDRQIVEAFQEAVQRYREMGQRTDRVFFSSLGWHKEDAGTTRYLMNRSGLKGHFVPLEELRVEGDQLTAGMDGKSIPIDLLYRLHPLEILAKDTDEEGYPTGAHVLDLIARRKLSVINPPVALISQSKALQALIWNLFETGQFLDSREREAVGTYMLPTYLENRFLGRKPYVMKPVFGREGDAVHLYGPNGEMEHTNQESLYLHQMMVYQKRVEMETVVTETLKGRYQGHLLWGSFWVGGQASAILARVDGPITGNLAYYLPVGLSN